MKTNHDAILAAYLIKKYCDIHKKTILLVCSESGFYAQNISHYFTAFNQRLDKKMIENKVYTKTKESLSEKRWLSACFEDSFYKQYKKKISRVRYILRLNIMYKEFKKEYNINDILNSNLSDFAKFINDNFVDGKKNMIKHRPGLKFEKPAKQENKQKKEKEIVINETKISFSNRVDSETQLKIIKLLLEY